MSSLVDTASMSDGSQTREKEEHDMGSPLRYEQKTVIKSLEVFCVFSIKESVYSGVECRFPA